jgi:hypothetical protein
MFNVDFDVLLYDLTSTYFECDPPGTGKRRYGYSRDKRFDCVQVVIALVVTPDGFPLCYEVMEGNTSDRTTLRQFLDKIEGQYGKAGAADRDRASDRRSAGGDAPIGNACFYLVGTPKSQLNKLEAELLSLPQGKVRESLNVKLLKQDGELYVWASSSSRQRKSAPCVGAD